MLVGDSPDGGRCVLIGGRASWCWWAIVQTVGGVYSSVGVPPGVGGHIPSDPDRRSQPEPTCVAAQCCSNVRCRKGIGVYGFSLIFNYLYSPLGM